MPTILAFIIITSSEMLYQSFTTVVQLYSLKGELDDLTKLEYSVNTKRVIKELPRVKIKNFNEELNYKSGDSKLDINQASGYFPTADKQFNGEVKKIFKQDKITKAKYDQLENAVRSCDYTKREKNTQRYTIVFVDYKLEAPKHKLLLLNKDNKVIKNLSVK